MASAGDSKEPSIESEKDIWKKAEQQFTSYEYGLLPPPPQLGLPVSSKRNSEFFDPCQDFANASIKCLRRNNSDKEMCQDYFKYDPILEASINATKYCGLLCSGRPFRQRQLSLNSAVVLANKLYAKQSLSRLQERMGMATEEFRHLVSLA